jgi:cobyrinic acid a,c-diamide synthase
MIKWFAASMLVLNLDKTNVMKVITKKSSHSTLHIGYKEDNTERMVNTKPLGLQIENHKNWKNRIEQIVPKSIAASYAIRSNIHINDTNTVKSIFCAYFHSIVKKGIVFLGQLFQQCEDFHLQKKIIIIIAGAQPTRTSCRRLFK